MGLYVGHGNATKAYLEAGYADKGEHSRIYAQRVLRNANVAEEIERRRRVASRKLDLSMGRVLAEVYAIAFSNVGAALDPETGRLLPLREMPVGMQHAISELTEVEIPTEEGPIIKRKLKLHPKWPALRQMIELSGVARALGAADDGARGRGAAKAGVRLTLPDGSTVTSPQGEPENPDE